MKLNLLCEKLTVMACGLLFLLIQIEGQDSARPIRTTHTGQVQGSLVHVKGTNVGVHTFLGIPFAKPPLGALRFAPPEPPEPWNDVRDGTSHPAMCLQKADTMNELVMSLLNLTPPTVSMSEDCLYLSIYSPAHAHEGSNLPVMVWIHGGALVVGMASLYDGSMLAATENVVVVTIQYRLGVLGFFSTGDQHARGNWGFLDQVAALRWVQQNIAHFGGNPDRVTIFGESAGGASVSSHVVSPMSQGLFHGAIMESGVALLPDLISNTSEVIYTMVANLSRCEQVDSESLVNCLRGKSEEEILAINKAFRIMHGVVDGAFLPRHPQELLASADFQPVTSIIGVNNDEFGWLLSTGMNISDTMKDRKTFQDHLRNLSAQLMLPPEFGDLLMEEYMRDTKDPQTFQAQFLEIMADIIFIIPALQTAHFQSSHAPVYFYEFQHRPSFFKNVKPPHVKADHGDEIPFVFGSFCGNMVDLTEEEQTLNKMIMKYWANFARNGSGHFTVRKLPQCYSLQATALAQIKGSGPRRTHSNLSLALLGGHVNRNPNGDGLLDWPVFDQEEQYLQLDIQPAKDHALKDNRFQFWTKILPQKIQELKGVKNKHTEL